MSKKKVMVTKKSQSKKHSKSLKNNPLTQDVGQTNAEKNGLTNSLNP